MSIRTNLTARRLIAVVAAMIVLGFVISRNGRLVREIPHHRIVPRLDGQFDTGRTALKDAPMVVDEAVANRSPMAPVASPSSASEVVRPTSLSYSNFNSWHAADLAAEGGRMIVRTGGASIEVSSVDSVIPKVRLLATQVGGFVANSSIEGGRQQMRSATLEVRAPSQSFDALLAGLSPLGHVESVNVSAQDVGEEYVDLHARIDNDHRLEQRLIELINTRTGKLKDVLDVERELARVREEIERYEGRLRYLSSHAALSTLTVNVHEPVPITAHVGTSPLTLAARQAWQNFVGLVAFCIASLGVLIPMGVAGAAVWWMFGRKPKPVTAS